MFIISSYRRDKAWFHVSVAVVVRYQDYLAIGRFSNNPQTTITTWEDWHDVMKIVKRIEQAMKREKIEGFVMDSRIVKRVESEDDSRLRNLSYFA